MTVKSHKATTCPKCGRPYARVGLTAAQQSCLDFIKWYIAENNASPSYADITTALDLKSKGAVHRLVRALKERGHIDFLPHRPRSITVLEPVET